LSEARALEERAKILKDEEEREWQKLVGSRCPKMLRRLFEYLYQDHQPCYSEIAVIEAVFEVEKWSIDGKLKARLSQLQRRLNIRLSKQKSPFRVRRPRTGFIQLVDAVQPHKAARAKRSQPGRATPKDSPIQDCREFIASFLQNGPVASKDLASSCRAKGYKRTTVRNALSRLPIKRLRKGFGKDCQHFISLEKERTS
jgi:hypothetical protein